MSLTSANAPTVFISVGSLLHVGRSLSCVGAHPRMLHTRATQGFRFNVALGMNQSLWEPTM
jgi:hypothetical protein